MSSLLPLITLSNPEYMLVRVLTAIMWFSPPTRLASGLAGQQLMAGLGLVTDLSDTQQLLAWLEGRPRERFGIVLTNVQDLVMAPAEEQQGFLDLLDNILHVSIRGATTRHAVYGGDLMLT